MSNLGDFYLESLITEAFKGKGFQKLSELFEEKISFSLQRHSKTLLNVLDRLINKELDRNAFKHVLMLMKCVQHFCKNPSQEDFYLIQQGLVSKISNRTLEFLRIWDKKIPFVPELVEEFFDTAVIICRSNNKDGVKQLQDSFLFHLGYVITEKWPSFHIQLEAIKTFNNILDHISREDKKSLQSSEEMSALLKVMARKLFDVGDYDCQVAISEALCRLTPRKMRENLAHQWFEDSFFAAAFLEMNDKDFETDCRIFLNCLNLRSQEAVRVYTYPCIDAFADTEKVTCCRILPKQFCELQRPQDSKLEQFWIDFNSGSNCITFYTQNPKGVLWDSVRLTKDSIAGYTLQEVDGQKQLDVYPKAPILISCQETKHVKICFEKEHDIESAISRTYGKEIQMVLKKQDVSNESESPAKSSSPIGTNVESKPQLWQESPLSPCKSEVASSNVFELQSEECLPFKVTADSTGNDPDFKAEESLKDVSQASNVKSPTVVCKDVRVVLSPVHKRLADRAYKDLKAKEFETKRSSPKKSTERSSKFDFPDSSQSGTDIELVMEHCAINSPESSSKRKKTVCTPSRPISRTSSLSEKKTVKKKTVVSSESAVESEKSWIMEHKKSTDYSRKKAKPKSKLKVLPLSSGSSNDDLKGKKYRSSAIKPTTQVKGRAKSLSFSDLKLPGVSGLLTPGNTTQQSSALTISDLDDHDLMDPLQETSSPDCVQLVNNQEKGDLQSGFSSAIEKKALAEDDSEEPQKKRKRLYSEELKLMLKPRKLFGSCDKESAARLTSPVEDIAGGSFISSFESFTEQLQNKMMYTHKKMENQAQDLLTTSHQHVSNLMSQIQQCKIKKLQHFQEIVVRELSTLEADTQALKELEKETLEILETQAIKVKQFCVDQSQRLEAVLGETKSLLTKNNDPLTDVTESTQK